MIRSIESYTLFFGLTVVRQSSTVGTRISSKARVRSRCRRQGLPCLWDNLQERSGPDVTL